MRPHPPARPSVPMVTVASTLGIRPSPALRLLGLVSVLLTLAGALQAQSTALVENTTLLGRYGEVTSRSFSLSSTRTLVLRVVSDYTIDAGIFTPTTYTAFANGQAVSGYATFSSSYGIKSVTLAAGNYVVALRNRASSVNTVRFEVDYDFNLPGQTRLNSQTDGDYVPANGGRLWQPFTIAAGNYVWVDGANSGVEFYLIPGSQLDNFRNNRAFSYLGSYGPISNTAQPGGVRINEPPGEYALAFVNRNAIAKTVVYTIEWWTGGSTAPGSGGSSSTGGGSIGSGGTGGATGTGGSSSSGSAGSGGTPLSSMLEGRLSNLSVRTSLATAQNLIVGFTVSGGAQGVMVRAAGPALGTIGLSGFLPDPMLELYRETRKVVQNDDWASSYAGLFSTLGAFPFRTGSADALILETVNGSHSVVARSATTGGAGLILVEAYDAGPVGNSARLTNLSARNHVGTGDNILIAGFAIRGIGEKKILIRAVGPALQAFGVASALADPILDVYDGFGTLIGSNNNWAEAGPRPIFAQLDSAPAAIFSQVGAFPLPPGSRDAALFGTLPGLSTYTAHVRGANNTTGEALIEIYEVP